MAAFCVDSSLLASLSGDDVTVAEAIDLGVCVGDVELSLSSLSGLEEVQVEEDVEGVVLVSAARLAASCCSRFCFRHFARRFLNQTYKQSEIFKIKGTVLVNLTDINMMC